ncbi:outer membrane protein assembly factor BamA, partial [Candidatus Poribacteria bacterium]|nr:outer membrane protein assembly factor BamA [Candidatus Poribacteria bacterium]
VDVEAVDGGGLEVVYQLTENPKIEGTINIIGNEKLKYQKIKNAITLKPGEIYSDRRRWESEQNILKTYKEAGYYLATVQTDTNAAPDGKTVSVTFEITEGPQIEIREINFIGNHNISLKTLSKQIKTRVGKRFDEGLFEQDLITLLHYYQDEGYAHAKISGYEKRFTEDKTGLMLDIPVDEGPQYIVGTYNITIQQSEKPAFSEGKIREMLNPAEGEIFNRGAFQNTLDAIQQGYRDKGYILSEITPIPHYDEINGTVDMALNIVEGDVIIIDQVRINGLEKTKDNVIRRELDQLDIKPGEFFDVSALRKARQRLFQMGPFIRNVDFVPSDSVSTHRDLLVNIAETPRTGMFSLGGGYGTEGGIFGVAEIGENNLFGRAYRIHLKGELGARDRHTAELRFGTPWIFGTPTRLDINLYNTQNYRRYYGTQYRQLGYDRYIYTQKGGSVTLGRPIFKDIDVSVRLKNERINATRAEQAIVNRSTRSVTLFLTRDTRDYRTSLYNPVSGSLNTASYEYSGGILGADNRFQKYSVDSSWFLNTWRNFVFATHVRAGYLNSQVTDSTFLFFERYQLGGVDTIRGYEDYEILPSHNNGGNKVPNLNGGDKVLYANLEYRFPITAQLSGVAFFDMGQVWDESTSNIFKELNFKKGVGAGIRFDLFGMQARLEWGYGFDRERDGRNVPGGKFHFTIGPGF